MSQHEYTVPLFIHEDGTLAMHGSDIRGLVIEADTFEEMRAELLPSRTSASALESWVDGRRN